MKKEFQSFWESLAIQGKPVYTLAECVARAAEKTKNREDSDEEPLDPLTDILERFPKAVSFCNAAQLDFLRLAAEHSKEKNGLLTLQPPGILRTFEYNNFLYIFKEENDWHIVFPLELQRIFEEVTSTETFADANARSLEQISYATALVGLYGYYEIQHFANVWNRHHSDKITRKEAESFLTDLESFDDIFYLEDDFVVNDFLWPAAFDALWEETHELPYYMPPKSVIREYAAKRMDDNFEVPGQKEMNDFLAAHIPKEQDLEFLQFLIFDSCERLESPESVWGTLADYAAPLEDTAFVEKFERLYNILRSHTHIWELRGFTPSLYQNETGKAIPYFRLPKKKVRKKSKKSTAQSLGNASNE